MNMNKTKIITHKFFGSLEVITEGEKVFFPATEVAKVLGYTNPHKALLDHCLDVGVTFREGNTNAGKRQKKYISEGNLYRLIVRSKLPQAVTFESWVFDEVLPQIRREGIFMTQSTAEEILSDPEAFFARALVLAGDKIKGLETRLENAKEAQEFIEQFVETKELYTIRETAKILGLPERIMVKTLEKLGHLYRINKGRLLPHWTLKKKGYAEVKIGISPYSDHSFHQIYFTPKGLEWLTKVIAKEIQS